MSTCPRACVIYRCSPRSAWWLRALWPYRFSSTEAPAATCPNPANLMWVPKRSFLILKRESSKFCSVFITNNVHYRFLSTVLVSTERNRCRADFSDLNSRRRTPNRYNICNGTNSKDSPTVGSNRLPPHAIVATFLVTTGSNGCIKQRVLGCGEEGGSVQALTRAMVRLNRQKITLQTCARYKTTISDAIWRRVTSMSEKRVTISFGKW